MLKQLLSVAPFCLCASTTWCFQAPANNNCSAASTIAIPNGGFALGNFTSETVDLSQATLEPGENLPPNVTPPNPGSVWFEFYLPTSRQVKITFARTSGSANARVALAVYKDGVCLPTASDLYNLLLPLDNYGDVLNPCVGPGHYRVQVLSTLPSTEKIYLVLDIAPSQTANVPVYDLPTEAYNFSTVFSSNAASHKIECHSIDGPEEYTCLPATDSARYTKSSWYVFRFTNTVTDLIRIRAVASGLPDSIGYRLFEGDCRAVPPFGLPVIFDCGFLEKNNNTVRSIEHPCLLKPDTWYSFELLFPQTFESGNTNMLVFVDRRGEKPSAAPRPLIGQIPAPSNQLGTLPQGPGAGVTTNFTDYFSCNGRMALNDCGAVNPAAGVDFNGRHFDIATFATFELNAPANITLNFQQNFSNLEYPFVRLFSGAPTDDCNTLSPGTDIIGQFQEKTWQTKCLPAGKYTLQVLGSSGATWQNPIIPFPQGGWDYGHLGLPFTLNITAQAAQAATDFSLRQPGDVNQLNGFQPLQPAILYSAQPGLFGCGNSVLPAGSVCFSRKKMMVREWQIGDGPGGQPDEGLITLSNLAVHYSPGNVNNPPAIRYRVYSSSLHALANAQNAHAEGALINGAQILSGCIPSNNSSPAAPIDNFCFCAVRDTYALAGFGDEAQINHGDQPRVLFDALQTTYSSRALAENMANISAPGMYISKPDFFSCLNNPATLGGKQPCYLATKLIYREFYLDQPRTLTIQQAAGAVGDLRLFSGQASDPAATLSAMSQVTDCFGIFSDPCLVFQPGWYTLVSYGHGPGYNNPVFNNGDKGDVGKLSQISITVKTPDLAKYNRPYKAYNAGITNWKTAQANVPSASTDSLYVLGTETFACTPDTPFSIHPIQPCVTGENRFAYYVFEITEPSYVVIQNVPKQYHTEVFAFDVRTDSARLLTDTPVYPCAVTQKKQLCNLPPGVYTLVIFARDADKKKSVTPELYIERAGTARFDHAINAYDFGAIPGDGQWYDGKPGDTHPTVPGLAPSYDVFYCSTGAQLTDPPEGIPYTGVGHNPNVYNPVSPYVLFTDNVPTADFSGNQKETWRNLWMSFVLTGSGDATLRLDLPALAAEYPAMVVYESDVNGAIPFATLQTGGGIDSVKTSGLNMVQKNFNLAGVNHDKTLTFNKNGCLRDTVRYYLVLTLKNMLPNVPVAVSISYNAQPTVAAPYDLYPDANVINGLQQTAPPYTPIALGAGLYRAVPFVLNCATRSPGDPSSSSCYTRSVWYKIEVGTAGKLRFNLEKGQNPAVQADYFWGTNLYRETVPGTPASLVEITTSFYGKPHPQYPYLNEWEEGCVSPGTYYLFFEDCYTPPSGLDIHTPYSPVVWIEESIGDFCSNAVPVNVTAAGVFSAATDVDCHTIGEGFGEDGSAMGCLGAPVGLKSTWYKITVSGNEKLDINFQLELPAGVNGNLLRYRLLYGACTAMTPGPCNTNGNTIFTLNCLTAGDYYVQLISPLNLKNKIGVKVTAVISADQNCIPINPVAPFAAFSYTAGCDSVQFQNTSTVGPDIQYQWLFPGGQSSTAMEPVFLPNGPGSYPVTLIVRNSVFQLADTLTQTVVVQDLTDSTFLQQITCDPDKAGTIVQNLNNQYGCDSTVVTAVIYDPLGIDTTAIQATTCDPALVGTGQTLLTGADGCDSLVITVTTLIQADSTFLQQITCDPDKAGVFVQNLNNQYGCDSTVVTAVIYDPAGIDTTALQATTCDPALAGTAQTLLIGADGCDSLVITVTTLIASDSVFSQQVTCNPNNTGVFVQNLNNQFGCDSTVVTTVTFDPAAIDTTIIPLGTCDPTAVGSVQNLLTGADGCDSLVITVTSLDLSDCPPIIQIDAFGPTCAGGADGYLILMVFGGLAPYQFSWSGGGLTGTGQILTDFDTRQLTGLPSGTFTVTVTGQNGRSAVSSLLLMQPPPVNVQLNAVLVSGPYAVRCAGDADGVVQGLASGGSAPYQFAWSVPGQTEATLTNVGAGIYALTVTDVRGCSAATQTEVLAPPPLLVSWQTDLVKCGDSDVEIEVAPSGGVPPFLLTADGLPVAGGNVHLSDGEHIIEIADANGCMLDTILTLTVPPVPKIFLPADTLIQLGQPLLLEASTNLLDWDTVVWTPLPDTSCAGCLRQEWLPGSKSQLYRVTITDLYGCTAQAVIVVRVEKTLEVYVPNAFNPGSTSGNDIFRINAGASAVALQEARIYDRWGNLAYQWDSPVDPNQWPGWDGRIGVQAASPGVYVYYLKVLSSDGNVETVEGSLTLFR